MPEIEANKIVDSEACCIESDEAVIVSSPEDIQEQSAFNSNAGKSKTKSSKQLKKTIKKAMKVQLKLEKAIDDLAKAMQFSIGENHNGRQGGRRDRGENRSTSSSSSSSSSSANSDSEDEMAPAADVVKNTDKSNAAAVSERNSKQSKAREHSRKDACASGHHRSHRSRDRKDRSHSRNRDSSRDNCLHKNRKHSRDECCHRTRTHKDRSHSRDGCRGRSHHHKDRSHSRERPLPDFLRGCSRSQLEQFFHRRHPFADCAFQRSRSLEGHRRIGRNCSQFPQLEEFFRRGHFNGVNNDCERSRDNPHTRCFNKDHHHTLDQTRDCRRGRHGDHSRDHSHDNLREHLMKRFDHHNFVNWNHVNPWDRFGPITAHGFGGEHSRQHPCPIDRDSMRLDFGNRGPFGNPWDRRFDFGRFLDRPHHLHGH